MYERRGETPRQARKSHLTGPRDADNDVVSHFTASVGDLVTDGRRLDALRAGLACWRLHTTSAYYAKPFVLGLAPRVAVQLYRSLKGRKMFSAPQERSEGRNAA